MPWRTDFKREKGFVLYVSFSWLSFCLVIPSISCAFCSLPALALGRPQKESSGALLVKQACGDGRTEGPVGAVRGAEHTDSWPAIFLGFAHPSGSHLSCLNRTPSHWSNYWCFRFYHNLDLLSSSFDRPYFLLL